MTLQRRWAVVAVAAVIVGLVVTSGADASTRRVNPASSSARSSLSGEIALPALYGHALPTVSVVADESGYAWTEGAGVDLGAMSRYTSYASGAHNEESGLEIPYVSMNGSALVESDSLGRDTALDIDTGVRSAVACDAVYFSADGDQWCLIPPDYDHPQTAVLTNETTGATQSFTMPPLGSGTPLDADGRVSELDGAGALLGYGEIYASSTQELHQAAYLDFATGHVTTWSPKDFQPQTMTSTTIAGIAGGLHRVAWVDRSDPSTVHAIHVGDKVVEVAVSGSDIAYTTRDARLSVDRRNHSFVLHSGPMDADPGTYGEAPVDWFGLYPGRDGNFLVLDGDTVRSFGLYRARSGADAVGGSVALFGSGDPLGIGASAGRIVTALPEGSNAPVEEYRVRSARSDERLSVSSPTRLPARLFDGEVPSTSGGNAAYLSHPSPLVCDLVITDGRSVEARYRVPLTSSHVTLSGGRALVTFGPRHRGHNPAVPAGSLLVDLTTGRRTVEPQTTALSGDTLAYFEGGSIVVKDVRTGVTRTIVKTAVRAVTLGSPAPLVNQLAVDGRWVLWSTHVVPAEDAQDTGSAGLRVYDMATHTSFALPADVVPSLPADLEGSRGNITDDVLGDGVVAWIDRTTRQVHLARLTPEGAHDRVVGTADRYVFEHQFLAMTDEFLAWVAKDGATRVLPLGGESGAAPEYLSGIQRRAFDPGSTGRARTYRPQLDVSRPLTHWRMVIRGGGRVVRVLYGRAPLGNVRPRWNGRTVDGSRAPAGRYVWTLTGRGPAGTLRRASGSSGAITGRVRLEVRES